MSALRKRVRIGKYTIPALLLASLAIGTVAAVSYVILTFTISLPVAANPRVHFYNATADAVANTMTIELNIFPNIRTIDENNEKKIRSVDAGDLYIRVSAMDTADIAEVIIVAYETVPATDLFNQTWTGPTATWSGPYTTDDDTDYNLWIEVAATSGATPPGPATITVELMVENP